MAGLTPAARQVVATPGLGGVVRIYGPQTLGKLVGAAIAVVIGAVVFLATAALTGSRLVPVGSNPLSSRIRPDTGVLSDHPAAGHWLPLVGGLFVLIGLITVITAVRDASSRVVLCQGGVAMATRKTTGAFRWSEVSSVKRRSQSAMQSGSNGPTFTVVRWYTVVRTHDGRTFVLDSRLIGGGARKLGRIVQQSVRQAQPGVAR